MSNTVAVSNKVTLGANSIRPGQAVAGKVSSAPGNPTGPSSMSADELIVRADHADAVSKTALKISIAGWCISTAITACQKIVPLAAIYASVAVAVAALASLVVREVNIHKSDELRKQAAGK